MSGARLALVHQRDLSDPRTWSGTPYHMQRAIAPHVDALVDLSPAPVPLEPLRYARGLLRLITGRTWAYEHEVPLARLLGHYYSRRLAEAEVDAVLAPAGSAALAFVRTDLPVIYYSDATWRSMRGYYDSFSRLLARSDRHGDRLEARTLQRADLALFASAWARRSAIEDYGADPERCVEVGIGANLEEVPNARVRREPQGEVRLLLIGVSWRAKGGDIAVAAVRRLRARGLDVTLDVVGCRAPTRIDEPGIRVHGFLDKTRSVSAGTLNRLWEDADLLLLPSRYEAAGVVLCEAAAHALPVVASRTGGIPSLVRDGVTGILTPGRADADTLTAAIETALGDPGRYVAMSRAARREYDTRLGWEAWGERVGGLIDALVRSTRKGGEG